MKFATAFQITTLLSVAPSAMARVGGTTARRAKARKQGRGGRKGEGQSQPDPAGRGGGDGGGRGSGKGEGQTQGETVIVELKKDKDQGVASLASHCQEVATVVGGEVLSVYDQVLNGCSIRISSQTTAAMAVGTLSADPRVMVAEEDQTVYASQTTTAPSWGLDRVNQCSLPLDSVTTKVDAAGVRVYVVDTGIYGGHEEFSGMIAPGSDCHKSSISGEAALSDGNGHGTHVAGTVCGTTYGVAEGCDLCAVKVLSNSGSGSTSGVIAGVNHVVANCKAAFPDEADRKCVANMSLGGGFSSSLNAAVQNAAAEGVVMVVAAGNDNGDACTKSPASEATAITVGSTDITDINSSFSNYGDCVDVYAPGRDIKSAWPGSPSETNTISGTSMASPHVAGIAAGLIREGVAPAAISDRLKATAKLLDDKAQDGTDQWLTTTVSCQGPTPPPTPPPPTSAPTPCSQSAVTVGIVTDNYPGETSWTLENTCNGDQVGSGGSYTSSNTEYKEEFCVPPAKFKFTINDTYGDGICCGYGQGGYEITMNGVMQVSGGEFGSQKEEEFGSCDNSPPPPVAAPTQPPVAAPTPPPTNAPTPSPTTGATTTGPTFFTCAQFNEANGMACTKAYGGGKCQWLGTCHNCGCVVAAQAD